MSVVDDLLARNETFASERYEPGLRIMPTLGTIVLCCVDPRVDPADVLGLELGEVAVIRNVGGRVTPDVLDQLAILAAVVRASGAGAGPGPGLVLLQHTDCGITRLGEHPDLLAGFFGVGEADLDTRRVGDPYAAVGVDLGLLADDPRTTQVAASGLVYDVATGRVGVVAPPSHE